MDLGLEDRAAQTERQHQVKLQGPRIYMGYLETSRIFDKLWINSSGWKLQSKLQHIKQFL